MAVPEIITDQLHRLAAKGGPVPSVTKSYGRTPRNVSAEFKNIVKWRAGVYKNKYFQTYRLTVV
jgi:hypothetical protein